VAAEVGLFEYVVASVMLVLAVVLTVATGAYMVLSGERIIAARHHRGERATSRV
jgi:hypothetical protein